MVLPVKSTLLEEVEAHGFTVVKGVIPKDRCASYVDQMQSWLESYEMGYKRDDKSTWSMDNIPFGHRGGLYNNYQVGQLQFAWDVRTEEGVVNSFAELWQTQELLASFDAINISLPLLKEGESQKAWAHQDQSPLKPDLWCVQGIANLAPNGPLDGGLMVLKGALALNGELFKEFAHLKPEEGWNPVDYFQYTPEQLEWLYARGCTWEKVCADAGDLILWDSRTPHYGAAPEFGGNHRFATYVCMVPKSFATEKQIAQKAADFQKVLTTTHAPFGYRLPKNEFPGPDRGQGKPDHAWEKYEQLMKGFKPKVSDRGLQLAGVLPY